MDECIWPRSHLHQALSILALHLKGKGLQSKALKDSVPDSQLPPFDPALGDDEHAIKQYLEQNAYRLDLDILPIHSEYPKLDDMLTHAAPAIFPIPFSSSSKLPEQSQGFIILLGKTGRHLQVLNLQGDKQAVAINDIRQLLTGNIIEPVQQALSQSIASLELGEQQREKVLDCLLNEQLVNTQVAHGYLLRLPTGENLFNQLKQQQYPSKVLKIISFTVAFYGLMILSWYAIGQSLFQGAASQHMYSLWALLLLSAIGCFYQSLKLKNRLSMDFGALLRRRLLDGLLKLEPEQIRHQSSGQFLGRVMDIELVEAQSLSMVFVAVTAIIQLIVAAVVLTLGAGNWMHVVLLVFLVAAIGYLSVKYERTIKQWMACDLNLTSELAENMVGHRTRLAQEPIELRHKAEDQALSQYTKLSERLDSLSALIFTIAGRRVWLVLSLILLYPAFINSDGAGSFTQLSATLGAILLAAVSLDSLANSLHFMLEAKCAWSQLRPLYDSATNKIATPPSKNINLDKLAKSTTRPPIIQANNISYARGDNQVLKQCDLTITAGDKFLLEGESGAGKSTLGYLLAGMKQPDEGNIELYGCNYQDIGSSLWQQKVVVAPQFHENFIVTETLAFNLLMGRQWPPTNDDLIAAENICQELNLGYLIDKMPAGLFQMVGECGWNLSHGEQSRIFMARALLQNPELLILDESFAALDPNNLNIALNCVMQRSNALLLTAHP